jgi:hypothetical protein
VTWTAAAIAAMAGQVAGPAAMGLRICTWWIHGHDYTRPVALRQLAVIGVQWASGLAVAVAVLIGGFTWVAFAAWLVLVYVMAQLIVVAIISAGTGLSWPQVYARLEQKVGGRDG